MLAGPILWYLLVSALGALVFPLVYRLFPALPGRGYAFSRAFGLLVWGYLFWLLSSLGVLANDPGGYLFVLVLIAAAAYWVWRKTPTGEIIGWLRGRRAMVITIEVLFLLAFIAMLLIRAMDPGILGTEKPMELAFINAILRSPSMPPHDPWLSGYAISYYYFGYVLVAMLAKLTGVAGGIAFNLGISLVFALAAVGAYGLVYDLLSAFQPQKQRSNAGFALLGPLFALIVSNVEGFLEYLHSQGVFWQQNADGGWQSRFWLRLGIENLSAPPPGNTAPDLRFWWWWRASRVLSDYDLAGNHKEVIDEFPFFSYFLGDLHPHVLSMPFVFLAMALALNLFLARDEQGKRFRLFGTEYLFSWPTFILGAVVFGGLGFLNIWDFPWYAALFVGAHFFRQLDEQGWRWESLWEAFQLLLALGFAGVLVYLPFYLSFSSQAGGILPNVIYPTRGVHLWIMFGTLFVPLLALLLFLIILKANTRALLNGLLLGLVLTLFLLAFSTLLAYLLSALPTGIFAGQPWLPDISLGFLSSYGVEDLGTLLREGFALRGQRIGSAITLLVLTGLAMAVLWPPKTLEQLDDLPRPHRFAALLVLFGGLLVLVPEHIYLRDLFNARMNTIFKFYYQGWLIWSVAAAYGSAVLLGLPRRRFAGWAYAAVLVIVLVVGLTYPFMALDTRITSFSNAAEPALNLDGADNFYYLDLDEKAAVAWLQQAPQGTLVEAVGGSYTQYARISTYSGQPALIGWLGHEDQWRGGRSQLGTREQDVNRIYSSGDWQETAALIQQYDVRYIVVGQLERSTYQVYEDKFFRYLTPVFQQGSITIYQTSGLDD